ncbi:MAG: carboxypeptidase-like regulatory domain-containing protein [Bryobacter sp.]|nr:carboxypeptidase-like regulatory domain-containing protein [Bryobacter sp.]
MQKLLMVLLVMVGTLAAQDPRGSIIGRVVDGSGAPVVGATIKITSTTTGVVISTPSNETGDYRALYLIPAIYNVEVEAAGFSKLSRPGVQVRTTETVTLDLELKVGQVSETVEVKAETPLLNSADVSLGQVIDQRRIE